MSALFSVLYAAAAVVIYALLHLSFGMNVWAAVGVSSFVVTLAQGFTHSREIKLLKEEIRRLKKKLP